MTKEAIKTEAIENTDAAEQETVTEETGTDNTKNDDKEQESSESTDNSNENTENTDDEPVKKEKGIQKRMEALTADKYKARSEAEALRKQNEALLLQLAAAKANNDPDKTVVPTAEIEALANAKAKDIAAQLSAETMFNNRIEDIWQNGVKEYTDFSLAVENIKLLGETFQNALPIIAETTKDAHKVIHHLSQNLDESNRILSLPPIRLAAEIARLEASLNKPAPPKQISNAAKPITTVSGTKPAAKDFDASDTSISTEQWMKNRTADLKSKGKKPWK